MPHILYRMNTQEEIPVKKIVSLLLAVAAVASLSACKVKTETPQETDPVNYDEFQAQVDAYESEVQAQVEASIQAQEEINEEIDKYIAKVGKTKKNKELVMERGTPTGREFQKYVFDKKGNTDYRLDYFFFDTKDNYEATIQEAKDNKNKKVVEKDADMKLVVVKRTNIVEGTFDELYESFSSDAFKDLGYTVIE